MEPTKKNESIGKAMTYELADLFAICPPSKLRRSIEDIFFNYLMDSPSFDIEERKELIFSTYHLINFLNEAEKINRLDDLGEFSPTSS